jgi:hypothetical protein
MPPVGQPGQMPALHHLYEGVVLWSLLAWSPRGAARACVAVPHAPWDIAQRPRLQYQSTIVSARSIGQGNGLCHRPHAPRCPARVGCVAHCTPALCEIWGVFEMCNVVDMQWVAKLPWPASIPGVALPQFSPDVSPQTPYNRSAAHGQPAPGCAPERIRVPQETSPT